MYYVYILRSVKHSQQYVGFTSDLSKRIEAHNAGQVLHTSKFKPWMLVTYTAFKNEHAARRFEKYLKTGSGRAFRNRHFLE